MKPGWRIGKILGIPIYLDLSWIFIFALVTYDLATLFTKGHAQWSPEKSWAVGLATSGLFFCSIIFHELSHSVIAQHYKIKVVSITLFLFGGVARIAQEPSKALQEFNIAIAGPISSYFLAACFYGLTLAFPSNDAVGALGIQLAQINFILATFNLLPGFPLDGGRIFRAIVWGATKNFTRAAKIASTSGKAVAVLMVCLGVWRALVGDWANAWLALIGIYLLNAANQSVAHIVLRESVGGLTAADVMLSEVPTIAGHITLEDYGGEVLRTGRRCHLVLTDDRLVGMMNVHALNSVPRDEWMENSVQAVMIQREKILWATPGEPLDKVLTRLVEADINQMPVVSNQESEGGASVVGMITRDSILRVMQTRAELRSPRLK